MKPRNFACFIPFCLIAVMYFLSPNFAKAQATSGVSSDGKDFYVGYVLPSYNRVANKSVKTFFGAYALVSSYTDNTVHVSYFDSLTGIETVPQSYKVTARTAIQILLDTNFMRMSERGDTIENAACHITADQPINVQYFSTGACSGGSYLCLATPALGKKYVIASYPDNPGDLGLLGMEYAPSTLEVSEGFFLIVAAFDNTKVTIIPNSTTMGGHSGFHNGQHTTYPKETPYYVTLKRGQSYLVKSAGDASDDDISGSIVEANKPIAVLGGHENAAIGGVSGRGLEGRDFMVEQMIPAEFFDTIGYVSVPLLDSQPADANNYEGVGDNYRVNQWDPARTSVELIDGCVGSDIIMSSERLAQITPERFGVTCPVSFTSTNGVKFSVMLYDQRNFATSAPYPAPSMMTIIPMSRWKKSFMWYVPVNRFEILQEYYVNVIAPTADFDNGTGGLGGILASFNAGLVRPIKQVMSVSQQWKIIPNAPGYSAIRFKLSPGSYYATGPNPFIVYNFGMRAFDPNFDLGDFDGDDFFFSYANPTGASLSSGDKPNFKVVIDSQCGKWNFCVTDNRKIDHGIRSVTLLNDPMAIQYSPAKQSVNCAFDASVDPNNFGEIELPGTDSAFCFSIHIVDPFKAAHAAVMITDNAGNKIVVESQKGQPKLQLISSAVPIDFGVHGKGSDTCMNLVIKNISDTTFPPQTITAASILGSNLMKITGTQPALPVQLHSNDTLAIQICFTGKDTSLVLDTLKLGIECYNQLYALKAQGTSPVIFASDLDFGTVDTGQTLCMNDTIWNIGVFPLILSKNFISSDTKHFSVSDSSKLPLTVAPGGFTVMSICYTPGLESDSTRINWAINESDHSKKDYSLVKGKGVVPALNWNMPSFTYYTDTLTSVKQRYYLLNHGVRDVSVDIVKIIGADSAQFTIVADQLGFIPLSLFPLHIGDSIWVDIRFTPILSGAPPERYANRHAQAVAIGAGEKTAVLDLIGTFATSSVPVASPQENFSIRPNPANGNSIILSMQQSSESAEITIFDVLGREVYKRNIPSLPSQFEIPISQLQNGTYYARISSQGRIVSEKFEVMR